MSVESGVRKCLARPSTANFPVSGVLAGAAVVPASVFAKFS